MMLVSDSPQNAGAGTAIFELNRLWSAEVRQVRSFWRNVVQYPASATLDPGLASKSRRAIILHGWACDMCILPDGRRQIFSFFLPGDQIEIPPRAENSVRSFTALTKLELVDPHHLASLHPARGAYSAGRRARDQGHADDRLYVYMVRLGQLNGRERLLHLFLELYERLDAVGLVKNNTFSLPVSQEVVADALGLSIVHVNRTIQRLRREGLVICRAGKVTLAQPGRLADLAGFRA